MENQITRQLIQDYLDREQWTQVIALCQTTLQSSPHPAEIYALLGEAFAGLGEPEEAIAAYTEGLKLQPNHIGIHAQLGQTYSQTEQFGKAIAHYQWALSLKPDWSGVHYNLGLILHQLGEWDEALTHYKTALALDPEHDKALFNVGLLYNEMGQPHQATEYYRQLLQDRPDSLSASITLGQVLSQHHQYEEAFQVYRQAIAVNPDEAMLFNNLGELSLERGRQGDALEAYQRAIELDPTLAIAHHNLGCFWHQQHNFTQAETCFQTLLALVPDNIEALDRLGTVSMALGKWEQALACFRRGMAQQSVFVDRYCQRLDGLNPQDWRERAQVACAQFLTSLQRQEDAATTLAHLESVYRYVGELLIEYGSPQQAEGFFQRALHLQPRDIELYVKLGNCLAKQQRLDAAIAIYRMGLSLQSHHPQLTFQLGLVLEQQGRFPQAISYYEQLLQSPIQEPIEVPQPEERPQPLEGIFQATADWVHEARSTARVTGIDFIEIDWSPPAPQQQPPEVELPPDNVREPADCGGVTCHPCMSRLIRSFEPMQLGAQVFRCTFPPQAAITPPATFVVSIPQGRAWIAPQKNSWMICKEIAIITPDLYLLGDVSRFYPWYLPGCRKHDPAQHTLFSLDTIPPVEEFDGTVAVLSALSGHIYYHWMIDVLPRIGLLRASGLDLDRIDGFAINSLSAPFQRETLDVLGIPAEKCIESDRHPHIQARQLVVPSFPGHLDWVSRGTTEFLRQTFLGDRDVSPRKDGGSRRIYISRAKAQYRQLLNEAEAIALLETFGFESVCLEDRSVMEQAQLFASAEAIVAPHGGGLTNLVFCQPNTTVVELFSPNYVRTDYWMISQQLQLQHYYILGQEFHCHYLLQLMHQNSLTEDIWVDLDSLRAVMRMAGFHR